RRELPRFAIQRGAVLPHQDQSSILFKRNQDNAGPMADDGDLVLAAAGKSTPSGFDREHAALKNDPHVENVITSWAGGAGWAGRAGSAGRAGQHEGKGDSQVGCPRSARPLA